MRIAGIALVLTAVAGLAGPGRVYVTELGRRVLTRCDQVVEARVAQVQPPFRGITTARLAVSERLSGYDRNDSLILMYVEDFIAPDALNSTLETSSLRYERVRRAGLARLLRPEGKVADRPKVTRTTETVPAPGEASGVRLAKDEEGIFFLEKRGATYALVGFVPRRDPLYESKHKRLREVLRIEAILGVEARARHAKVFYTNGLRSVDAWERGNSAREVRSLALRFPGIFDGADAVHLAELLFDEPDPVIQAALERAVRALDPEQAHAFATAAEAREREQAAAALQEERERLEGTKSPELRAADIANLARRYRRAATALLVEQLQAPEPIVRETTAQALAEYGGPSARPHLRRALAGETNRDVAQALLYACGVKSDPDAVEAVAARLRDKELERTAIHALARIGTAEARAALASHRDRTDAETAALIGRLLEEEFARNS